MSDCTSIPCGPLRAAPARARLLLGLVLGLVLSGCQGLPRPAEAPPPADLGARLDRFIRVLASPQSTPDQRLKAAAGYRGLVGGQLPGLLQAAERPGGTLVSGRGLPSAGQPGVYRPAAFADLVPVEQPREGAPGLYRAGLGLPLVGRVFPGGPDAPDAGFHVPLTLLALPRGAGQDCCEARLVDPRRIESVGTRDGPVPVAMDLEAAIDATRATGPRLRDGVMNLLRPERLGGESRLRFLEPYDRDRTPVVLVHGLMSTPRMWAPALKALLADRRIRDHYQFWFYYYPTGKPIPISALRLREALDAVSERHPGHRPMILVGHSMGGILARTQVSRIAPEQAAQISPRVMDLPASSTVRRALVFEPRPDVGRVVFMFTPHRGSRLAVSRLGHLGIRLARLPQRLLAELAHYADLFPDASDGRLPTSIHGLSPHSEFLKLLDQTRPAVPAHSIIGVRRPARRGEGSDGVVAYRSAHLDSAESERVVRAGHSGVGHPDAIAELRRILILALDDPPADPGRARSANR